MRATHLRSKSRRAFQIYRQDVLAFDSRLRRDPSGCCWIYKSTTVLFRSKNIDLVLIRVNDRQMPRLESRKTIRQVFYFDLDNAPVAYGSVPAY